MKLGEFELNKCKDNLKKYKNYLKTNFYENKCVKNIPYDYLQLKNTNRKYLIKIILVLQKQICILNLIESNYKEEKE